MVQPIAGPAARLARIYDRCLEIMARIAAVLTILIVVGVSFDVLGRYFFAQPIGWVFEATEYALLFIPFLAMAWLVREKSGHVQIELVIENLRAPIQSR